MKFLRCKGVAFIISSLFLVSCSTNLKASYKLSLDEVIPSKSFLKTKSISIPNNQNDLLSFEDDFIKIDFSPNFKAFDFKLQNKTTSTIKLIWNDVVFVDTDNQNYRSVNSQTKFINDEKEIPSASIIPNGILEDMIYPSGWVYYDVNIGAALYGINASSWKTPPLFPIYIRGNNEKLKTKLFANYKNKTMKILLPFLIKDNKIEYIFTFNINEFNLKDN